MTMTITTTTPDDDDDKYRDRDRDRDRIGGTAEGRRQDSQCSQRSHFIAI